MAIGYSLHMCARHVDSTNPGRSNFVFRSKPIQEAEMLNRLIVWMDEKDFVKRVSGSKLSETMQEHFLPIDAELPSSSILA